MCIRVVNRLITMAAKTDTNWSCTGDCNTQIRTNTLLLQILGISRLFRKIVWKHQNYAVRLFSHLMKPWHASENWTSNSLLRFVCQAVLLWVLRFLLWYVDGYKACFKMFLVQEQSMSSLYILLLRQQLFTAEDGGSKKANLSALTDFLATV